MRGGLIIAVMFLLLVIGISVLVFTYHKTGAISSMAVVETSGKIDVYFCHSDNCTTPWIKALSSGALCAIYDISRGDLITKLNSVKAKVVVDNGMTDKQTWKLNDVRIDSDNGLMHNKWCVMGDTVVTGSHNPTANTNYDNMIVVASKGIAANYRDEFLELWNGKFGRGNRVRKPVIRIGDITLENYFCPEDDCEENVRRALMSANRTIDVMAFSFTSDPLGKTLVLKKKGGVLVRSMTDKGQLNEYSEDYLLNRSGVPVKAFDGPSRTLLHHKVFIVDGAIVVTGSANPTSSGYHKNDENVIIIHSKEIARKYTEEFERIWAIA